MDMELNIIISPRRLWIGAEWKGGTGPVPDGKGGDYECNILNILFTPFPCITFEGTFVWPVESGW